MPSLRRVKATMTNFLCQTIERLPTLKQTLNPVRRCMLGVSLFGPLFGWIHEIACPSENELYVAELLNWRAQKIVLEATH